MLRSLFKLLIHLTTFRSSEKFQSLGGLSSNTTQGLEKPFIGGKCFAAWVSLHLWIKSSKVDKEKKIVRLRAGIRVQQLVDAIKEYDLTLQNFTSIREQQIGGIFQVAAGARLPPIDEQVIGMKLVTPAKGTIELSKDKDQELFHLSRCGLAGTWSCC
ncbi:hypothetical protein Bca101_021092 [Brassica carinata]